MRHNAKNRARYQQITKERLAKHNTSPPASEAPPDQRLCAIPAPDLVSTAGILQQDLIETKRLLLNKIKEAKRAKATRDLLREKNRKLLKSLNARDARKRLQSKKQRKEKENLPPPVVAMKDKDGSISATMRGVIRQLTGLGVPEKKVGPAIEIVAKGLGVQLKDSVSARSVGRIASEAGIAAQLQIVDEMRVENSSGMSSTLNAEAINDMGTKGIHSVQMGQQFGIATTRQDTLLSLSHPMTRKIQAQRNQRQRKLEFWALQLQSTIPARCSYKAFRALCQTTTPCTTRAPLGSGHQVTRIHSLPNLK